jgi:hypothetical protein
MSQLKTDKTRDILLQSLTVAGPGEAVTSGSAGASLARTGALLERVLVEMRETRNFLASWFAGAVEKPEDPMNFYLQSVLAENFSIIRPNGLRLDRQQTLLRFYENLYASDPTVLRHDNSNIRAILLTPEVVIVDYDESHVYRDHSIVNALSAVFQKDDEAPNGVRWLRLHETSIQPAAAPSSGYST